MAQDPAGKEGDLRKVEDIHQITPYGMFLASLGTCTAIVVNAYARYHGIPLEGVELRLDYERIFKEDCEHCEETGQYKEQLEMTVDFRGDLTKEQREKLFRISHQCPVHKTFVSGIPVKTHLEKESLKKRKEAAVKQN